MALLRAAMNWGPRVCAFVRTVGTVAGRELRDLAVDAIEPSAGSRARRAAGREALTAVAWRVVPTPEQRGGAGGPGADGRPRATEEIVLQPARCSRGAARPPSAWRARAVGAAGGALLGLLEGGGADEALVIDALGALGGERSRQALDRLARRRAAELPRRRAPRARFHRGEDAVKTPIVDSHCHLDFADFGPERADVLARGRAEGITRFVTIGSGAARRARPTRWRSPTSTPMWWRRSASTPRREARDRRGALAAVEAPAADPAWWRSARWGLDHHYDLSPRDAQAVAFRRFVAMARRVKKPW